MTDTSLAPPAFFNYHEYGVTAANGRRVVVTHFPNVHTNHRGTRIVRVPRSYDHRWLYLIPQFSTYYPGHEPAAIVDENPRFEAIGRYDGAEFGAGSVPPLERYMLKERYDDVIGRVNELLRQAYDPFGWNALDNVLDIVTGTLYSKVVNRLWPNRSQALLRRLEDYVEDVSRSLEVTIVLPRRTGYLSLDIEVPAPLPNYHENCTPTNWTGSTSHSPNTGPSPSATSLPLA